MWTWFHQLASPPTFFRFADLITPWLLVAAIVLLGVGAYGGLFVAPADYQQGDAFRIIYVHVPAASLSLFGYTFMAVAGGIALIWRMKLAECAVVAAAPVGGSFCALALVTGMLWGKPMWGAYWVWQDARLVSELILLFFYAGVVALNAAFVDRRAGARASAWLALVGVINVPIVHYSVKWWNTLHQGSTILKFGKPSITGDMLWPLLVMLAGFFVFFAAVVLRRMQNEVLDRERGARWAQEIMAA
jgi:heme exporter protein C